MDIVIINEGTEWECEIYYKDKFSAVLHREDEPAVRYKDGVINYYLNGKKYSEKDYWAKIRFGDFV